MVYYDVVNMVNANGGGRFIKEIFLLLILLSCCAAEVGRIVHHVHHRDVSHLFRWTFLW